VTWRKVTSGGRRAPTVAWLGQPSPARGPRDDGEVSPRRARRQPPAFALRAVPLPLRVPTGSATARSDWTLDHLRRPTFKLARKPRQGPRVGTNICLEGSSVASAHSDWTLVYLRIWPTFKLARESRGTCDWQGPRALTQGKSNFEPNRPQACPCHGAMVGRGPVPQRHRSR
jgi:hypothetical protein